MPFSIAWRAQACRSRLLLALACLVAANGPCDAFALCEDSEDGGTQFQMTPDPTLLLSIASAVRKSDSDNDEDMKGGPTRNEIEELLRRYRSEGMSCLRGLERIFSERSPFRSLALRERYIKIIDLVQKRIDREPSLREDPLIGQKGYPMFQVGAILMVLKRKLGKGQDMLMGFTRYNGHPVNKGPYGIAVNNCYECLKNQKGGDPMRCLEKAYPL